MLHKGIFLNSTTQLNLRTMHPRDWKEEAEANQFAAELLMPEQSVFDLTRSSIEANSNMSQVSLVSSLARRFNVSDQAMTIRLSELGILTST